MAEPAPVTSVDNPDARHDPRVPPVAPGPDVISPGPQPPDSEKPPASVDPPPRREGVVSDPDVPAAVPVP